MTLFKFLPYQVYFCENATNRSAAEFSRDVLSLSVCPTFNNS